MAISIATPSQFLLSSSADINDMVTVGAGRTLMACVQHPRDTPVTSIKWDDYNMTPWVTYAYPNFGWSSLSIFALPGFSPGTKYFFCSTGAPSVKRVALFAWDDVGYFYNALSGEAEPGGSAYVQKTIYKNSATDAAFMVCCALEFSLTTMGGGTSVFTAPYLSGQHGATTGLSTTLVQYTDGSEIHVTWITLVLQEYSPPPPADVLSPVWIV